MTRDPVGRSGEMLMFWSEHVQVKIMDSNDFSIKLQVCTVDGKESFWVIFMYANTDIRIRQRQWETSIKKKQIWEEKWIIGRDFNDIKAHEENTGGMRRL